MLRFALVEDDETYKEDFLQKLHRFFAEKNLSDYEIVYFPNGEAFLSSYKRGQFQTVFMDIEMPGENGIEITRKLRRIDEDVSLVFITIMAQFALTGYEVNAIDYLVKPVIYTRFQAMMEKITKRYFGDAAKALQVSVQHETRIIPLDTIYYIEVSGHMVSIFTDEEIIAWGTLSNIMSQLPEESFIRCSNKTVINLSKVTSAKGYEISLGRYNVVVSRSKKEETLRAVARYQGLR